jgi:hypothetical protein
VVRLALVQRGSAHPALALPLARRQVLRASLRVVLWASAFVRVQPRLVRATMSTQ